MAKTHIVFVKENPQIRIFKQALGLARTGNYELTLVASRCDRAMFERVFDRIIDYTPRRLPVKGGGLLNRVRNRLWHIEEKSLARTVRSLKADLFHAHAEPNWVPRVVIENAQAPVVFDAYDFTGIRYGVEGMDPRERLAERFCLENADGLVHKGPDGELGYYRSMGYSVKAPQIQFQDYCIEGLEDTEVLRLSRDRSRFDIVFVGSFDYDSLPDSRYGYIKIKKLVQILATRGMCFTVYQNPYQRREMEIPETDCLRVFLGGVRYSELANTIGRHGWGSQLQFFDKATEINPVFRKVAHSNKVATYLEAGLPILVSSDLELIAAQVRNAGIGLVVPQRGLKDIHRRIASADYQGLVERVLQYRKGFSLDVQIGRLERFYAEIA